MSDVIRRNELPPTRQKNAVNNDAASSFLECSLQQTIDSKSLRHAKRNEREQNAAKHRSRLPGLTEAIKPGLHTLDELRNTRRAGPTLPAKDSREYQSFASKNHHNHRDEPEYTPFSANLPSLESLERQLKRLEDDADRYRVSLKKLAAQSAFKSLYNMKACINAARAKQTGGATIVDDQQLKPHSSSSSRNKAVEPSSDAVSVRSLSHFGSREHQVRDDRSRQVDPVHYANSKQPDSVASRTSRDDDVNKTQSKAAQVDELNKLASQLMRAEMLGDADHVRELKSRIASLSHAAPNSAPSPSRKFKSETRKTHATTAADRTNGTSAQQLLMKTTAGGQLRPVASTSSLRGSESVRDMLRYEKEHTTADTVADFVSSKKRSAPTAVAGGDGEYDDVVDDARGGLTSSSLTASSSSKKRSRKLDSETLDKMDRRERERAILEHRQREHAFDTCTYCLDGRRMPKHLVMAIGEFSYLHLPQSANLVDYQCQISPIAHAPNGVQLDENVYSEMQQFKRALTRMCQSELQCDAVFIETHKHRKQYKHCVVECFPVDSKQYGEQMPFAFHNAIVASEDEWAQNIKLIDLKKRGGLRRVVPGELPYFAVEFGVDGTGYAHVIENEASFADYFGKEVIAGILDIDPHEYRRERDEPFEKQCAKVAAFKKVWSKHDDVTKKSAVPE